MARVALVTGGSRGIGKAIVTRLAAEGYSVVINYSRSQTAAEEVAAQVGGIAVRADVSRPDDVAAMAQTVEDRFGRLDVLVNNAGQTLVGDWRTIEPDMWNKALEINLGAVFHCIRTFAPMLLRSDRGRVINIGSVYSDIGNGFVAGYAAAKAGIRSLTRIFARELAPHVLVNTIAPGDIDTEMTRAAGEEFIAATINRTPLKRLGRPEEIAALAAFLAGPDASFITGQTIVADGGRALGD